MFEDEESFKGTSPFCIDRVQHIVIYDFLLPYSHVYCFVKLLVIDDVCILAFQKDDLSYCFK